MAYARRWRASAEDFIVARRSAGPRVTTATLVASVIGAGVLFSPAEAGTWAGLAALIGYGIGRRRRCSPSCSSGPGCGVLCPTGTR